MKKAGILLSILILSSILVPLILAQDDALPPEVERLRNFSETVTDEEKRDYLAQEWKNILLKNKAVAALDTFFTEINIVFKILFGMDYSLSGTLFVVILLWVVVFLITGKILGKGLGLDTLIAYIIGVAVATLFAQIRIFKFVSSFLIRFALDRESAWARTIAYLVILGIIYITYFFGTAISSYLKEAMKKRKEKKTDTNQEKIEKFTEGLESGTKKMKKK